MGTRLGGVLPESAQRRLYALHMVARHGTAPEVHDPAELHGFRFMPAFMMQAFNLGARYGVLGDYIDTRDDPDIVENLRNMTVVASDHMGRPQSVKHQSEDETHLYITAIMAADFLRERGEALKKGDLISVGALADATAAAEWGELTSESEIRHVHYYIGDRVLRVSVRFN